MVKAFGNLPQMKGMKVFSSPLPAYPRRGAEVSSYSISLF
jgi:hypothetical protein